MATNIYYLYRDFYLAAVIISGEMVSLHTNQNPSNRMTVAIKLVLWDHKSLN